MLMVRRLDPARARGVLARLTATQGGGAGADQVGSESGIGLALADAWARAALALPRLTRSWTVVATARPCCSRALTRRAPRSPCRRYAASCAR